VHELLSATDEIKLPITATFLSELTEEWGNGSLNDDDLLEDHPEALALKRLGLATIDSTAVKVEQECYHYDLVNVIPPQEMKGERWEEVKSPTGKYERCDDRWKYRTTITLRDPGQVDKASMAAKVPSLSDVGLTRSEFTRKASSSTSTAEIGSIEIEEVSDVVPVRDGVYTVGFKCRFKPNSLGEVFDVSSPIFKSMPLVVRNLFVDSVFVTFDKRLRYLNAMQFTLNKDTGTFSEGGMALGHAELVKEVTGWKVTSVSLDQKDQTKYTYHRLEQ
jgi:hypothetical protein